MGEKLTDNQVNGLLQHMAAALKDSEGRPFEAETVHGQAALETAAKVAVIALAILAIQLGLEDDDED